MRKTLVRLICCFVPSSKARHCIRRKYVKQKGCVVNTNPKLYRNNKIVVVNFDGVHREIKSFSGANITFDGDNNYIELHEPIDKIQLSAHLKSNTDIIIYSSKHDIRLNIYKDLESPRKNRLVIGSGFWATGVVGIEFKDDANVIIGDNCMFSFGITLRTTDHHTIIEKGTNNILNPNKDIVIGNHVWIGSNAMILKGSVISDNTVVGAQSVVTGKFDETNVVIAGIPARAIKHNIDWDGRDIYTYEQDNK